MPFATDEAWPIGLQLIFDHARTKRASFEQRYYGAYDKLLNYCFGDSFTFYVAPQTPPRDDSSDARDVNVSLVVCGPNNKPVLIVEAKDYSWAQKAELRYRADALMHDRYALLLGECTLPRLRGLSFLGTSMRLYSGNSQSFEIAPTAIPRPGPSTHVLPRTFLAGEWELDILSEEGFAKMKEVVDDIIHETEISMRQPIVNKKTMAVVGTAVEVASMRWEKFVRLMTDLGFTYHPGTSGASVRFDPPNPKDRAISFHKPHPNPTIPPKKLRDFSKKLHEYYGWDPEEFLKATQAQEEDSDW